MQATAKFPRGRIPFYSILFYPILFYPILFKSSLGLCQPPVLTYPGVTERSEPLFARVDRSPAFESLLRLLELVPEEQVQGGHAVLQSQRQVRARAPAEPNRDGLTQTKQIEMFDLFWQILCLFFYVFLLSSRATTQSFYFHMRWTI